MNKPFFELVQQDDKYVLDVSDTLNDMFRAFHQRLETLCEADFDQFARKLGYTKLGPGQCVVQAELLEAVIADMRNDCDCSEGYCNNECGGGNCHVKDLTAALDASGVGK